MVRVNDATFIMNNRRDAAISTGTLKSGYNEELDTWGPTNAGNFLKLTGSPGIGADIGVIYEWRPDGDGFGGYDSDSWNPDADSYKLRLGASVTDIGGIFYKNPRSTETSIFVPKALILDSISRRKNEDLRVYYRRVIQNFTPITTYDGFFSGPSYRPPPERRL